MSKLICFPNYHDMSRSRFIRKVRIGCRAIALLVLQVVSCTRATPTLDRQLVDHSFVTDLPCAAPCWYGLEVDQTTETDALAKVQDVQFIDHESRFDETVLWGYDTNAKKAHFDCLYGSQKYPGCVVLIFSQGVLKRIQTSILYTLTIETMIEKLGTPDFYVVFVEPGEGTACSMSFGWVSRQISADNYQKKACPKVNEAISPNTPITTLYYSAKDDAYLQDCPACKPFPGISWP